MERIPFKKLVASTLALSLFSAAPGLAPYAALAQMATPVAGVNGSATTGAAAAGAGVGSRGAVTTVPSSLASPVSLIASPLLSASQPVIFREAGALTAVRASVGASGPVSPVPGAPGVTRAAPETVRPASRQAAVAVGQSPGATERPSTLSAGRALAAQLNAPKQTGAAPRSGALDRFWTGSAAARASEETAAEAVPGGAFAPEASGLQPASASGGSGGKSAEPAEPVSPESRPELFPARSSRVGIGPIKYVWWNAYYNIMQWFNLKLARDPNRRVSWDKWPTKLGLLYLIAKIRYVRSDTLTDPYDYASNDVRPAGAEPRAAKTGYTADGSWVSDRENPRMGAENTRFGSNIPPKKVRPDAENMTPSAREAGKLKWRKLDENGKPVVQPALILNNLAGGWIQFQFHNFGGNTKRDPIDKNPHKLARTPQDNWPEKEATVDRTAQDPTRVTDNGRPTIMNERTQAWIQAQIYGTNEEELKALRSYKDGKMRLDENGRLPEDPKKPGIDLSGFTNNYNPLLSFLHWAFVVNHNNIADHLRSFHADWDDETLFQQARKVNVANTDMIHTVEWTEDLLQHPTLQAGMHAEWYGLLGPRLKNYLMRLSYRHPWFGRLIAPIRASDTIWGMPGSKWEHHDGPFQVPKHFRMVYRLHEMVLDEQEILQPGTDRTLDRIGLIDFVHQNTRPIVEKFGYDALAYSFARKSAGALKLHNFPRALSQFKNQQNGQLTDLAEMDIFRERTDGTGTYNEFRRSVGEPPVKSFLELTGGDAELARELEVKYEGDIEKVDAGIGILAEPKPAGFALSFTQFYQFVLNAPRRVKSNRHLTEFFTHKDYTFEGMEWVLHSGGMGGVIARAMRGLPQGAAVVASMEGVTRWFAPWPDTETFPVRVLDKAAEDSGRILKSNLRTLGLGTLAAASAWLAAAAGWTVVPVVAAALAAPVLLYYKRMLAWRFMQKTWQSAYTDRRHSMFPTLFLGEKWAERSATLGRWSGRAVLAGGAWLAWTLAATNPVVAALAALTAASSLATLSETRTYRNDMQVLKIAMQSRLREGYPLTEASAVPGATALERRYWFLVSRGTEQPVARFRTTYLALREHGLAFFPAFKTALLSHVFFGPMTQRGLGIRGRWKAGVLFSPFAIYVPRLIQAQAPSSSRVYAPADNDKGLAPGDVDMEEFDRMFRSWAPGRDYLTAYDFGRMREGNRWRDAVEGRGGPVSRFLGEFASKHRAEQLLQLYGDRVANEDKTLVPAISRDMLLRVYQGTAQVDIMKERALDGVHPDLRMKASRFRGLGWKTIAAIAAYYLVRDTILYVLVPYLLVKGFWS